GTLPTRSLWWRRRQVTAAAASRGGRGHRRTLSVMFSKGGSDAKPALSLRAQPSARNDCRLTPGSGCPPAFPSGRPIADDRGRSRQLAAVTSKECDGELEGDTTAILPDCGDGEQLVS